MTQKTMTQEPDTAWLMLAAFTTVFILSMAFRTIMAISADPIVSEFNISAQALGAIAGVFHISFALAQPMVGVALDRYGPKRVVLSVFLLAVIGSLVSAAAVDPLMLIIGQVLIGIGCAPALLASMLFISWRYPVDRFAAVSGIVLAAGGAGTLITGTPLAWVIDSWTWRAGFVALTLLATASWIAVLVGDNSEPSSEQAKSQTLSAALRGLGSIIVQPQTAGICCLAAVSYAAFLALRGLWIGPLLSQRYDFSLIEVGHVALAISCAGMLGPLIFGWLDPGGRARRLLIISCSAGYTVLFVILAFGTGVYLDISMVVFTGLFGGFVSLQYADLRSAYPEEMTGRALSVFTMAMFSGVAGVQWLSGVAAALSPRFGVDPLLAALLTVSGLLSLGTLAF